MSVNLMTCGWADRYVEDKYGDWRVKGQTNGMEDWCQHEEDKPNEDQEEEENRECSSPCTVVNIIIRHRKRNEDQTFFALLDTGARTSMGTLAAAKKAGLTIEKDTSTQPIPNNKQTNKQTNKQIFAEQY
jgi:hypothetical protein